MTIDVLSAGGIVMRRPDPTDAERVLALARDDGVIQWNPLRRVVDEDSARDWCTEHADWSVGAHATWVITDAASGEVVGTCSVFDIIGEDATASIGYRVIAAHRGRGVARTAVDAAARWAFAELGLARLGLAHSLGNEASCRVALAAGFVPEGTLRSAYVDLFGVRHDEHVHGRLASDPVVLAPVHSGTPVAGREAAQA